MAIINSRVNVTGSTGGVSVQQQGANDITVTVPGAGSQQVVNEVSTTAQLRIRPVLLEGSSTTPRRPADPDAEPERDRHRRRASPKAVTEPEREHQGVTSEHAARLAQSRGQGGSTSASPKASASATPSPSASSSGRGQHGR